MGRGPFWLLSPVWGPAEQRAGDLFGQDLGATHQFLVGIKKLAITPLVVLVNILLLTGIVWPPSKDGWRHGVMKYAENHHTNMGT